MTNILAWRGGTLLALIGVVCVLLGVAVGSSLWALLVPVWIGIVLISVGSAMWLRHRGESLRLGAILGVGLFCLFTGWSFYLKRNDFGLGDMLIWEGIGGFLGLCGLVLLFFFRSRYVAAVAKRPAARSQKKRR